MARPNAPAQALAADEGIDAIIASPLQRTRDTAEIVSKALGLDVVIEDGFRECAFGEWDGLTLAEVDRAVAFRGRGVAGFDGRPAAGRRVHRRGAEAGGGCARADLVGVSRARPSLSPAMSRPSSCASATAWMLHSSRSTRCCWHLRRLRRCRSSSQVIRRCASSPHSPEPGQRRVGGCDTRTRLFSAATAHSPPSADSAESGSHATGTGRRRIARATTVNVARSSAVATRNAL